MDKIHPPTKKPVADGIMDDEDLLDSSVISPKIPYVGVIPNGLVPGKSILIKGLLVTGRDKRFTINLSCGLLVEGPKPDDIALHIDFRFDHEHSVVLNTYAGGSWGDERRFTNPTHRGQAFEVRILPEGDAFRVAVNGENICAYQYRLALRSIKTLYVKGCVQVDVIQYDEENQLNRDAIDGDGSSDDNGKVVATTPMFKPPVPFTCSIPGRFVAGRSQILITGKPRMNACNIVVNLKCGNDVALHISVRFDERDHQVVVLNSRRNGGWETEKRQTNDFPFYKGGTFDMAIRADFSGFNIRLNGRHYMDFQHRFKAETVDGLEIEGDLNLMQVWFKM